MAIAIGSPTALGQEKVLRQALMACLVEAVRTDNLMSGMLTPPVPSDWRSISLQCSGQAAENLFSAMELVSEQTIILGNVRRHSGPGVSCFKNADRRQSTSCFLIISAGNPFLDAL
jgi:hypothetical protein